MTLKIEKFLWRALRCIRVERGREAGHVGVPLAGELVGLDVVAVNSLLVS